MIRILHAVNMMDPAGPENLLMNYYRKIDRESMQFDFLVHQSQKGAYEEEILAIGGRVFHAPKLCFKNIKKYFKYMKCFYKEHPEYSVIHSHIDSVSAFPLYASKKNNIPSRIAHSYTSQFEFDKNPPLKSLARPIYTAHLVYRRDVSYMVKKSIKLFTMQSM